MVIFKKMAYLHSQIRIPIYFIPVLDSWDRNLNLNLTPKQYKSSA